MNERISCLSVLRLTPGMCLARPLLRPDGAVLMPEGTELSDSQLGQLQQRGVELVYVREADPRTPEEIERDVAVAQARVDYIFRPQAAAQSTQPQPDTTQSGEARASLYEAVRNYRRSGGAT